MPTHAEQKVLPFTQQQLYDLVSAVETYPDFLPWCVGARIKEKTETRILADLVIGYKMFRERFTSSVTLDPAGPRIDVEYMDGPFKYLNNHWIFKPHPEGCEIDFYVDFEFKSTILQKTIGLLFNEAVHRMIAAFEQRAHDLYDK